MAIYGTALLGICLLAGSILGKLLGYWIGVNANVGGVGIAMILLILVSDRLQQSGRLPKPTAQGVLFWSSIYIPIVVAMAASQNVVKAISGGPVAILAGVLAVAICFAMVPLVDRIGRSDEPSADHSQRGDAS
jgi:malonate transporter MadL subunit